MPGLIEDRAEFIDPPRLEAPDSYLVLRTQTTLLLCVWDSPGTRSETWVWWECRMVLVLAFRFSRTSSHMRSCPRGQSSVPMELPRLPTMFAQSCPQEISNPLSYQFGSS